MRRYTAIVNHDTEQGGYWVSVPALPGCYSRGDTVDEALVNVQEAIVLYLETLQAEGQAIPIETESPQAIVVSVAA